MAPKGQAIWVTTQGINPEAALEATRKSIPELKERNRSITQNLNRGESFGVPYRCLTPRGLENVLVAGRCISTDRQANGSVRIMACCLNTGEAAGIAAAQSISNGVDLREIDIRALQASLKKQGVILPG